ncbi:hypothetical protein PQX77_017730 [Marasmius sp. AFHP31]|nr:hypothetical protein PQX77_017730 [Marasmius sp. AFHP31]
MAFSIQKLVVSFGLLLTLSRVSKADGAGVDGIPEHIASLRVLATIPPSCQQTCDTVLAEFGRCATYQCFCAPVIATNVTTCVNCLSAVKPENQTIINEAQGILNQYASVCNGGGISIPTQTASGFTGVVGSPALTQSSSAIGTGPTLSTTVTAPPTATDASSADGGSGSSSNGASPATTSTTANGSPPTYGWRLSDARNLMSILLILGASTLMLDGAPH